MKMCLPPPPSAFWASACGGLANCCLGKVLRPLSPAPYGHQSLCGSFLFPTRRSASFGQGLLIPGCIPTSARCLVTT